MDAMEHPRGTPPLQALNAIEHYDGTRDPSMWLDSIQEVADLYEWSDNTCLKISKIKLSGPARSWARCHQFAGWADFQRQLEARYGESKASAISRLERCWQRANESVKDFADRYMQDAEKAGRMEDETLVYNFTQRLLPEMKTEVARQRLDSIEGIVSFCNFWADMHAPPDENRAYVDTPAVPTAAGAPPRFPRNFTGPPRRPESRNPPPYRPPFCDNTNRNFPTNRPEYRPPNKPNNSPVVNTPAANSTAADSAVDELTKKFKRLELNIHHQMQDKDREIRTLRYALKRQQEQSGDTPQLNYMTTGVETDTEDEEDLDQELLTSLFIKRPADDEPQYKRTPTKRTAFDPSTTNSQGSAGAAAARDQDKTDASRRVPRQRQAFNTPPYPAGTSRTGPTAPPPAAAAAPSRYPDAGMLVSEKARKMAADICRSIKFDGLQEATLPPQAVLTCLAGHLAGEQALIHLGQDMARRVAAVLQGMRRATQRPATVLNLTAAPRAYPPLPKPVQRLYSRHPVQVLPKISTCKVIAQINGKDVDCVIDTGASTSAITLDCLRRLNLDSLIDSTRTTYLNADGRITAGKGKVPNLVLSLGEFETVINPTVTTALNYNVLIGNDVLTRARAVIDYNQGKMMIQVDPTCTQEIDINLMNPEEFYHTEPEAPEADSANQDQHTPQDNVLALTESPCPPTADTLACPAKMVRMLSQESKDGSTSWDSEEDSEVASECPSDADSEIISPASFRLMMQALHSNYASLEDEIAATWLIDADALAVQDEVLTPSTHTDEPSTTQQPTEQLLLNTSTTSTPAAPESHLQDCTSQDLAWAKMWLLADKLDHQLMCERMDKLLASSSDIYADLPEVIHLLNHISYLHSEMTDKQEKVTQMELARLRCVPDSTDTAPELLFFAEMPAEDDAPLLDAFTPHASDDEGKYSDVPELVTNSEDDDSDDEAPFMPLPRPHHRPFTSPLPEFQVLAEHPSPLAEPDISPAETFPDDDAWADNRDLSLASMIDRTHLTDEQFQEALQLLEDNMDVFCFHPSELGTCNVGSHTIDTGDAAPIKKAYYRMPFKKYEQLRGHVDRLLEQGIIRPSNSPWAAPMHLVPKKGGDTREVGDFRALNSCTKPDAFPIPRIDDILYNIGPANMYSVVDCFSGYLQIKLDGAPDDPNDPSTSPSVERSAFSVPWGHYEYLRMPFGLQGAPATYMRIQQQVFDGLVGKKAFVFFDDTITYSTGFADHKQNLIEIFDRLRKANLKLNPVKCQFFKDHVTFLGFVIDEKGLSPDPRLIEAIAHRREPHNAKAVASFLGLTGYYRRFVKDYSKIAAPLTALLSTKVKFEWGPEQQRAFETLKDKLTSYPTLRRPDFTKPFILHTDASSQTIGAILAQKDEDGKEHPVAYHSKKLTPAERNWPITHLECFAVVNAVCDHFADFLLGHPFTVYTDCAALQWLLTSQKLQGKLARWSLRLQEFQPFDIKYRKGSEHQAADAMTRHADLHSDDDAEPDPPAEILTLQEPPPAPLAAPPGIRLPADLVEAPATPGSAQSHRSLSPESLDDALRSAVRICIEGNIGCGKSSVVEALSAAQRTNPDWENYTIIPEPVHEWHHLLAPLYAAPQQSAARHSIAALLQVAVLNAYALRVPSPVSAPNVITERSSWSSLAVFLPAQNLPPSFEHVVSQTAHHLYPNLDNALPTAIIYLKTDPNTCMERIQQRQRHGENMLTLEYITKLHEQYEQEIALFPGPVITIDATKSKEAVAAAVKSAVDLLMGAGSLTPPRPYHHRRLATAPFHVQDFPMLRRLFPDRSMTTCDPYLLHLFPEQLLVHQEAETEAAQAPSTPPSTPASTQGAVQYKQYTFEPTPTELLYDKDYEVLVLYQNGPGTFSFSPQFCEEYTRRHGTAVDQQHRIDNTKALQLYAEMGPWLSNGPGANIQIAAVPRKAISAIQVLQVHADGTEVVYVDTDLYAEHREQARWDGPQSYFQHSLEDDAFPLQHAFRNEGYTLDAWVRLVRLRPMLPCGISLQNPKPPTLIHSATPPFECEHATQHTPDRLRLTGGIPHQSEGLLLRQPTLDQINMFDNIAPKPKRNSAKKALQQIHTWTKAQVEAVTGSHEVPSDLPCELCGSPHDWKSMLICSKCDRGFHTYCIGLNAVPNTEHWFCTECSTPKRPRKTALQPPSPTPLFTNPRAPSPDAQLLGNETESPTEPSNSREPSQYSPTSSELQATDNLDTDADANIPDMWQTAAEEEEAEDKEEGETSTTPLLEIWEDEATIAYLKHNQVDVELLPDDHIEMNKAIKRINKRAAAFYWNKLNGKLYKRATPRYPNDREVPPPNQRSQLIDDMHQELGHVGINKLCSAILARYYWMGVYAAVKKRLQQCPNCLRTKVLFKQQPQLRPLPPSEIWDRVAMDSMGPYPPTKRNNRFILVAVDACSKWVEARAVPDLTSAAMAAFFKEDVVARHGTPTLCCTDNGKEFQKDFKSVLKSLGVAHNYSSAYHPESNGQAEAAVKATLHGLQKSVGDNPFTWDDQLPMVLLGLRSTKHASTGYSPHFVLTGRHPVLPVERRRLQPDAANQETELLPEPPQLLNPAAAAATAAGTSALPPTGLDAGTLDLLKQRKGQQEQVKQGLLSNIKRAQEKQKKDFMSRHHSCPSPEQVMPAGTFVLLKGPSSSKMHRCKSVEGPFRLVKYIDGYTRAIIEEKDGKTWPVATSRLALWEEQ